MASVKRVDDKGRKLPDGFSQRPDGRYMARFTHEGQRITLYDKSLNTLKEKVNKRKYELATRSYRKESSITLNAWFDKWFETYYIKSVRPSTATIKKSMYENHVRNSTLGKMKMKNITQVQIIDFYGELGKTLGNSIISNIHSCIKSMFECAISNEIVAKNPTIGASKYIPKRVKKEGRVLTAQEEKLFLDFVKNNRKWKDYYNMFELALSTGMRVGEIFGLTWSDIDFDREIIRVDRTLYFQKNVGDKKACYHISIPKTENSKRSIPMTERAKKVLLLQQERKKEIMYFEKRERFEVDGVGDFVFVNRCNKPFKEDTLWRTLQLIVRDINRYEEAIASEERRKPKVFQTIHPHTLRHTFATRCFEAGMKPKTVQAILGHADIRMTMNIYTHVTEEAKLNDLKLFNEMTKRED